MKCFLEVHSQHFMCLVNSLLKDTFPKVIMIVNIVKIKSKYIACA